MALIIHDEQIERMAAELAALPVSSSRSMDEMLYDERALPRQPW
jgi:hypothetical protein